METESLEGPNGVKYDTSKSHCTPSVTIIAHRKPALLPSEKI